MGFNVKQIPHDRNAILFYVIVLVGVITFIGTMAVASDWCRVISPVFGYSPGKSSQLNQAVIAGVTVPIIFGILLVVSWFFAKKWTCGKVTIFSWVFRGIVWACCVVELIMICVLHSRTLPEFVEGAIIDFDEGFRAWTIEQYESYYNKVSGTSISAELSSLSNTPVTVFLVFNFVFDALVVVYWLNELCTCGSGDNYEKPDDQKDPQPATTDAV